MFVNDDIYYFLSDVRKRKADRRRLPDDMFCNTCKSNRRAMNRNWSNQKANPALKTKAGNK